MNTFPNSARIDHMIRIQRMTGLSLIELMIAIALGLLILAGLVTVFANSSAARNEVERTGRQIENGRYAVEVLGDDLRVAGYYGELSVTSTTPDIAIPTALPDPCLVPDTTDEWMQPLHLHVQGYRAPNLTSTPDLSGTTCAAQITNLKAGSDILVVRRLKTCAAGTTGCAAVNNTPHLQVSLCETETAVEAYKVGLEGIATFDRTQRTCVAGTPAVRRQYLVNIYFVSTDNGSGQSIPTLKRLELNDAGGWNTTALVEGIELLKIEYGLDTDTACDGQPDAYIANPNVDGGTPAGTCPAAPYRSADDAVNRWIDAVTARFFVLARNIEPSPGYTDSKTYNLGAASAGPYSDGYRRHVYSSLVRMLNPSGKRDAP